MTSDAAVGTDDQLVKAGVHRAGRRLVPLLVLLYFVNYLDRVSIRAAAAAGIGLVNSLGNLSGFMAPYVTGASSDATGSNRLGLWIVGICMVSAAVVTWMPRRTRNRPGA